MEVKLKKYFPMIRERKELLAEIEENEALREMFAGWERGQQEGFLDICTGVRGLKFCRTVFLRKS